MQPFSNQDSHIYPPQQPRSKATFEAILSATEDLLQEQNFEDITVQQIARRANIATGALYTRFKSKSALLPFLLLRFQNRVLNEIEDMTRDTERQALPLERKIQVLCRFLRLHTEDHMRMYYSLHRQFVLDANQNSAQDARASSSRRERGDGPGGDRGDGRSERRETHSNAGPRFDGGQTSTPFATNRSAEDDSGALLSRFTAAIANWLRLSLREVRHPNPEIAIRMATHLVGQIFIRELVFGSAEHVASPVILEGEMTRILQAYLCRSS